MNIRNAMLATANLFEKSPSAYRFCNVNKPDCNTPGCVLGWIGHYLDTPVGSLCYPELVAQTCGVPPIRPGRNSSEDQFYERMNDIQDATHISGEGWWSSCAESCVRVLRLYTDKYHPESLADHCGAPVAVREAALSTERGVGPAVDVVRIEGDEPATRSFIPAAVRAIFDAPAPRELSRIDEGAKQ